MHVHPRAYVCIIYLKGEFPGKHQGVWIEKANEQAKKVYWKRRRGNPKSVRLRGVKHAAKTCNVAAKRVDIWCCGFYHQPIKRVLQQSWVNTDFWLDKISRESQHTRELRQLSRWTWRDFVFKCRTILYFLRQLFARQIWFGGGKTCNTATQPVLQQFYKTSFTIGHFRVPKTLSFRTRLREKTILVKITIIIFVSMALHSASHWNRDLGQLWNGLFRPFYRTFKADIHEGFCSRGMLQAHFARVSTHEGAFSSSLNLLRELAPKY